MDRQALAAQLHHPGPGAVLGRGALRAGPPGRGEHLHLARAEVTQQAGHARAGVADTGAGRGDADPLHEVRPQPLVPALVELGGRGEELRSEGRSAVTPLIYQNCRTAGWSPGCARVVPGSAQKSYSEA